MKGMEKVNVVAGCYENDPPLKRSTFAKRGKKSAAFYIKTRADRVKLDMVYPLNALLTVWH